MYQKYFILLLLLFNIYPNEKSSLDIQNEIDSRNNQIELLKKEIADIEKNIIDKTKNEINTSELLLDIKKKIELTEKLIKSISREEKILQRRIDKSYIEIQEKEKEIKYIQDKLKENMVYAYKRGKPTFLESIFNIKNLNDITYKTKYKYKIII